MSNYLENSRIYVVTLYDQMTGWRVDAYVIAQTKQDAIKIAKDKVEHGDRMRIRKTHKLPNKHQLVAWERY